MPDDNSSDSPADSAPDSPSEPVEATPPVTAHTKENNAPNSLNSKADVAPASPSNAEIHTELRFVPRIRVRWHADAIIDGQSVCQGFIKDISVTGANIFLDHDFQKVKFIKLHIYVPPLSNTSPPHVMEVSAKVIYSAYDGSESLYHTGVNFTQFNFESDLEYLKSRIAAINHDA